MESKIQEALEAERVSVSDVYGDGRHVNIDVVSAAFEGKNSVQRQRMVYKVSNKEVSHDTTVQANRHLLGLQPRVDSNAGVHAGYFEVS